MPIPTCEQVKKDFVELKSIMGDFVHELKTANVSMGVDIAQEQKKSIFGRLVFIKEAVEIWLDPYQIELRRELAERGRYQFISPPTEKGTFVAKKAGEIFLIDANGNVLQKMYNWQPQGSSQGVSAWNRVKEGRFPGTKHKVITFIDEATGEILGDYKTKSTFRDFSEGKGILVEPKDRNENRSVYVDTRGREAFRHPLDGFVSAGHFSEGRAVVSSHGYLKSTFIGTVNHPDKYYIDENGKQVGNKKFKSASDFSEGMALVSEEDRDYYFVDRDLRPVFPGQTFERGWGFKNGFAVVTRNGREGFINKHGQVVVDFKYKYASDFIDGRAVVWGGDADETEIIIDEHGNELAKMETPSRGGGSRNNHIFSNGFLHVVLKLGEHVFYDRDGKIAFNQKFNFASDFSEGLALVEKDGAQYFINTQGEEVAGPFLKAGSFDGGVALVQRETRGGYKEFYIDRKGNPIFE